MTKHIWDGKDWVPVGQYVAKQPPRPRAFTILTSNSYHYESSITGERIEGRQAHKEHLRRHGCEEIGDAAPQWLQERQRMRADGMTTPEIEAVEEAAKPKPAEDPVFSFEWQDVAD